MGAQCIKPKDESYVCNLNLFKVRNVDDDGKELGAGTIEIGFTDLILYQKGKDPIRWPMTCLRRFGADADLFSFESGRRCPTGPGIYAFKCKQAKELKDLLTDRIYKQEDNVSQTHSFSRQNSLQYQTGMAAASFHSAGLQHNNITTNQNRLSGSFSHNSIVRSSGSFSSQHTPNSCYVNGAVATPPTPVTPTVTPSASTATNATAFSFNSHNYINTQSMEDIPESDAEMRLPDPHSSSAERIMGKNQGNYAKYQAKGEEDASESDNLVAAGSLFMENNNHNGKGCPTPINQQQPNYANLNGHAVHPAVPCTRDSDDLLENFTPTNQHFSYCNLDNSPANRIVLQPPPKKKMNYVELDLENLESKSDAHSNGSLSSPRHSPHTPLSSVPETPTSKTGSSGSYALIDFEKTEALVKSQVERRDDHDESLRKTRHNSTIE